ncbi:DUF998 domain-containing protein [Puniceibacterium sediminis]|uniref:Frag1/DRAM/Sfk1 family protein n=1 Tax=Puniceibacterium sediminis TaxID=1608407 RepID=A0A238Y5A5_9RHOB|nr:DUF998 domain-containing protein [Puniceibacterium sediminis]SNR65988.1 Protein of unknown function [Puniceibacterium sediminis]
MRLNSWHELNTLALAGLPILSGLWLATGVGVIGALTPGYSHIGQFMSVLGASGGPLAAWVNYLVFIPAEIWLLAFLAVLNAQPPRSRSRRFSIVILATYAVLLMAAALLPCDTGCQAKDSGGNLSASSVHVAHMAISAIAYPLALIGLLPLGLAAHGTSLPRRLALPVTALGTCLFLAIILIPDAQGLFQRLLEALIYLQIILLGRYEASIAGLDLHGSAKCAPPAPRRLPS